MGLVVAAVSLAMALARTSVLTGLRRAGRLATRLTGVLLVVTGAYVAYYGWYEIRVLRGGSTDDPVITATANVQQWLASSIDRMGALAIAAIVLLLTLTAVLLRRARSR
jgi:cytochrome c-type biogenesis protein